MRSKLTWLSVMRSSRTGWGQRLALSPADLPLATWRKLGRVSNRPLSKTTSKPTKLSLAALTNSPRRRHRFTRLQDPEIPVALTNAFNDLYRSQANYQASTYGAQVGAISRQQSGAQQAASILGGISGFTGLFGGPGSNAFFRG
jgi:hypothetical protein